MIRLTDARIGDDGIAAVSAILRSGQLIAAAECAAFERELADFVGVEEAVVVSSGTAALHLAALALGWGPGDAILVPDFTFPATANVVALTGAAPVLVEVHSQTYTIDARSLRRAAEQWSGPEVLRAVIPVHEFGRCADMDAVLAVARDHDLAVVEDAACALGAAWGSRSAGTFGILGCFSFHPRKSLTTGEGGLLTTDDGPLASRLRRLRNHGMARTPGGLEFVEAGLNYRLTEFQCALGRVGLRSFADGVQARTAVARQYASRLVELEHAGLVRLPANAPGHTWQTYMVVLSSAISRAKLMAELQAAGVETGPGAQCLSALGIYEADTVYHPVSIDLASQGLALPCHPGVTDDDVDVICEALGRSIRRQT